MKILQILQGNKNNNELEGCPVCARNIWIKAPECPGCGWIRQVLVKKKTSKPANVWQRLWCAEPGKMPLLEQVILYSGILLGVLISARVRGDHLEIPLVFSIGIAFVVAPTAFKTLGVDPNSPFIARFGLFVQQGLFWDVLIDIVSKSKQ